MEMGGEYFPLLRKLVYIILVFMIILTTLHSWSLRAFPALHAFLISGKRYVFTLVFRNLVNGLLGNPITRTKVHLTDGDVDEFLPIHMCIRDKVFPQAYHFLCLWHGFTQSWMRKVTADRLEGATKDAHSWIRSWLFELETVPELEDSKKRFFAWCDLPNVKADFSPKVHTKMMSFVRTSIIPNLPMLAQCYRHFCESMDERTTSPSEGLNSATKCGPAAAKANMSVATSGTNMLLQTQLREKKRDSMNQSQFNQVRTWVRDQSFVSGLTNYMAGLVTTYADASRHFTTIQTSPTTWLVYKRPFQMKVS